LHGPTPEKMNLTVGLSEIKYGAIARSYPTPILFIKAPTKRIV